MMSSERFVGDLKINVHRALNLVDNHMFTKNHPYIKVYLDTQERRDAEKGKYEENDDGKNPVFDLDFNFKLSGNERMLIVEVCGRELLKDSILGIAKLSIDILMTQIGGVRFSVPLMSQDDKSEAGSVILSATFSEFGKAKLDSVDSKLVKDDIIKSKDIKDSDKDLSKRQEIDEKQPGEKIPVKDLPAEIFKPHHDLPREENASAVPIGLADSKPEEVFKPHYELPRETDINKPASLGLEREVQGLNISDQSKLGQPSFDQSKALWGNVSEQDKSRDLSGLERARLNEQNVLSSQKGISDADKLK